MKYFFWAIAIFCAIFQLTGCGTDSGNPAMHLDVPHLPNPLIGNSLDSFICKKLATCGLPAGENCSEAVLSSRRIPSELGLDPQVYVDYRSVKVGISTKMLAARPQDEVACFVAMDQLKCSDDLVQASLAADLSGVHFLLRSSLSCQRMIQPTTGPSGH